MRKAVTTVLFTASIAVGCFTSQPSEQQRSGALAGTDTTTDTSIEVGSPRCKGIEEGRAIACGWGETTPNGGAGPGFIYCRGGEERVGVCGTGFVCQDAPDQFGNRYSCQPEPCFVAFYPPRCEGDKFFYCDGETGKVDSETCAAAALCNPNGTGPDNGCRELSCPLPGQRVSMCADSSGLYVCNQQGEPVHQDCLRNEQCRDVLGGAVCFGDLPANAACAFPPASGFPRPSVCQGNAVGYCDVSNQTGNIFNGIWRIVQCEADERCTVALNGVPWCRSEVPVTNPNAVL